MLLETLSVARDFGRVHEITSILIRYGFGDLVQRLGIAGIVERAGHVLHWHEIDELTNMESPERVRRVLEEMGPTFVKLGQIFATRPDLFSPPWIAEFEKLQDQARPAPIDKIMAQLKEDLGADPETVFALFDKTPLAAASIGQVHKAFLDDGTPVIVKIRRPGIRAVVEADLRLLNQLADIASKELKDLRRYNPQDIVRQFTLSMRRELDLAIEGRNSERMRANFRNHRTIVIPKVYWEWTSERVNVQEFIVGISGHDMKALDLARLDRKKLAKAGADAILKMILEDGFFHADPHPGNCFFLEQNRIAFIDFGMVGRLSEERRNQVINLLHGLVERDSDLVVKILLRWADKSSNHYDNLIMEIDNFIDQYHDVPLKDLNMGELLINLTTLLRDHQLNLPADLTLLIKAFITLEGLGRQLDPNFNLVVAATPLLKRAFLQRYSPEFMTRKGLKSVASLVEMLSGLPQDLHRILEDLRRGAVSVRLDISRPEWLGKELDRLVNRLSVSLVTASMIIGSSIVSTVEGGTSSFIGLTAFIGALFGGLWLLFSIWRSG
ncbi:MAG: AarF/UbiB family protein [Methylicorpusculum sp.]|uniref:ABC1 kinase family protein n=1 Tax=Methylicorpusculum sp. TaxID=2713644 RepID=UPI00271B946B|nr:AarF/UbiB family protein [Methylicorpusculum sp.]MDO8938071.1 AarF/UbiB family protein [Methylicorpusculum sp.]MDP2202180.1 AarF/UbiB family protein [Methylicorpusculum sp.]